MESNEREITDFDEIDRVLGESRVCRIALIDGDFPYIIPMCFGHNLKGKKIDLIKNNNNAAFEIDKLHEIIKSEDNSGFTEPTYQSITGTGVIEVITGIEKITGLNLIMKKYKEKPEEGKLPEQLLNAFAILKLTAGEFCCKERREK